MKRISDEPELATKRDLNELKNEVLNRLDYIVKELEVMREDREIGVYQTSELREQVDNHEKRLLKLEQARNK